MRNTVSHLLTVLLLTGGTAACTKEAAQPEVTELQDEFFVKAEKDGAAWQKPGEGIYVQSGREFRVFGGGGDNAFEEYLNLGFSLPNGAEPSQKMPASPQALPAEWLTLIGRDGVTNRYATANATSLPSVQITRLDTAQKIVEGRFEATIVRDTFYTKQLEIMRFTNGSFRVRYRQVR